MRGKLPERGGSGPRKLSGKSYFLPLRVPHQPIWQPNSLARAFCVLPLLPAAVLLHLQLPLPSFSLLLLSVVSGAAMCGQRLDDSKRRRITAVAR